MVEDFSTQFSLLYLPMKYLAIISRHPVYIGYIQLMALKMTKNEIKNVIFCQVNNYLFLSNYYNKIL